VGSRTSRLIKRICALWRQGLTHAQIGKKVRRSKWLVYIRLNQAGLRRNAVPAGGHSRARSWRRDKAVELYREGMTLEEAGQKLGVSRERVRQYLREAGEPRRPSWKRKGVHF